ncbi:uncharacterized protein ANIA_03024 [Aspergillus nidulans FGSC A4]|uniref:BTB domain transcription factor n=1 Tax=Emericella nidulans (strain FGSC A4 / ATCC 38163 / CBS 112.46 / NRRL 194 / M139) TaxID=227321 RepID=C8VIU9_EMENI|nr:hypothetical protein [Aspergillus nidulans FGSC A4]CBF83546.1 TPA: conserved hypothetical protein [Aspergillus nidulans FGSC A4]
MATRTSSRHAAQKAKEAMAAAPDIKRRGPLSTKRKGSTNKSPEPKREKKSTEEQSERVEKEEPQTPEKVEAEAKPAVQSDEKRADGPGAKDRKPEAKAEESPQDNLEKPQDKARAETQEEPEGRREVPDNKLKDSSDEMDAGLKTTEKREEIVPSNILEKGIIYFFYRGRVNVEEAHGVQDVARSFFILRPTPMGASMDSERGAVDSGAKCRLMMLPKKRFPRSGKDREMGFVEKAGASVKQLQEDFIAGDTYETSTRGTREIPEAKPYAEGVYAMTSTKRATHIVYHITLPERLGEIQEDFGLSERGSWLVQSKNPKFPSPPSARLPKEPEYPESILEEFGELRWIPARPELLDYPNAQFLMVGSAAGDLGKAATAEEGDKRPEEEQPEEELSKMEEENEERVESLGGEHAIYKDLGYHAQEKYSKLETTWK